MKGLKLLGIVSVAASLLVGCGSDSSTSSEDSGKESSSSEKVSSVETIYDLGKCTEAREGEVIFVEDEDADFVCEDLEWKSLETDDDDDPDDENSSSSQKRKSSSSTKETSSDGKSSSSNSTSSSSRSISSSSEKVSSSSVPGPGEDIPTKPISKKVFTGVVEMGPYTSGGTVKISELDEVLDPTGTVFEWEISSDLGAYTSAKVSLQSQYATIQASGLYTNIVDYSTTSVPLTLRALSDFAEKEKVNINVLTNLVVRRAIYLYTQTTSYKNVPAAKAKAEQEVADIFGLPKFNHSFEDLSIFGSSDDDAKLLAITLLLQGTNSDADLTKLLTNISTSIEEDGAWTSGDETDYDANMVKMADWAITADLVTIRKNLETLGGSVPDFEKYIYMFAGNALDFGSCEVLGDGYMAKNMNAYSELLGDTLVCDGYIIRMLTSTEKSMQKACTESREGNIEPNSSGTDYVCEARAWRKAGLYDYPKEAFFNPEYDYGTMKDSRDGKTYRTTTIGLQTWMAENLNYYDKNNGNLQGQSWCYQNVEKNCNVAGRLYTWAAAMNLPKDYVGETAVDLIEEKHQGICPSGWHVPDSTDWATLTNYVSKVEDDDAGVHLKSQKGWSTTYYYASAATDKYGFSAIPTGAYYGKHANASAEYSRYEFDDVNYFTNFWAATESSLYPSTRAFYWYLDYRYDDFDYYGSTYNEKDRGFGLRCVKN